jgi:hypothetical protein
VYTKAICFFVWFQDQKNLCYTGMEKKSKTTNTEEFQSFPLGRGERGYMYPKK